MNSILLYTIGFIKGLLFGYLLSLVKALLDGREGREVQLPFKGTKLPTLIRRKPKGVVIKPVEPKTEEELALELEEKVLKEAQGK